MKIVLNGARGGFCLSAEAMQLYADRSPAVEKLVHDHDDCHWVMKDGGDMWDFDVARNDPILVQVVAELGEKANGLYSQLNIVEIPNDVEWELDEYDGREWVAEKHRRWEPK